MALTPPPRCVRCVTANSVHRDGRGHKCRKKKTRRGMKKKPFVVSDCCHMELRRKEQSNTLNTLLRLRGGRRRCFRLAAVLETAGGLERFVERRRGGQLLRGLRLAAALVVAPPAALLR